jgi:hypothetical protein
LYEDPHNETYEALGHNSVDRVPETPPDIGYCENSFHDSEAAYEEIPETPPYTTNYDADPSQARNSTDGLRIPSSQGSPRSPHSTRDDLQTPNNEGGQVSYATNQVS